MFSKDSLKRLAEQASKATRLATNAGGTTNQWFAGQGSPEQADGMMLNLECFMLTPAKYMLRCSGWFSGPVRNAT